MNHRPEIDSYEDYRKFIADLVDWLKHNDQGFSYRNFSRASGIKSPSFLPRLVKGDFELNADTIYSVAKGLNLSFQETTKLRNLSLGATEYRFLEDTDDLNDMIDIMVSAIRKNVGDDPATISRTINGIFSPSEIESSLKRSDHEDGIVFKMATTRPNRDQMARDNLRFSLRMLDHPKTKFQGFSYTFFAEDEQVRDLHMAFHKEFQSLLAKNAATRSASLKPHYISTFIGSFNSD